MEGEVGVSDVRAFFSLESARREVGELWGMEVRDGDGKYKEMSRWTLQGVGVRGDTG